MLQTLLTNPITFVFWLVALIIGITIHEFSHAWSADRLGDPTPSLQGRLTLDPRAHLDPLGTLMLLIARFGWGKPVQFDPYNLQNPRRDAALISLAGPVSNLLLATSLAIIYRLLLGTQFALGSGLVLAVVLSLIKPVIIMNVILAVFNLIPIHPLDGFAIVRGILPLEYAKQWQELESYGMIFLIFLIIPVFGGGSPISQIISPVINFFLSVMLPSGSLI